MSLYEFQVIGNPLSAFFLLRLHAKDREHFKQLVMAYDRIFIKRECLKDEKYIPNDYYFEHLDYDFMKIFEALGYDTADAIQEEMDRRKKEADEKVKEIVEKMNDEANLRNADKA